MLKQYLDMEIETISLIVFSERCELKDLFIESPDVFVCNRDVLPRVMRRIWKEYPDCLNEEQIEELFDRIYPLTNQDDSVKKKHISDIKEKLDDTEHCPWCGGTLVLRTARQGPNAGNQFFGCSNYPKCRYTKNTE